MAREATLGCVASLLAMTVRAWWVITGLFLISGNVGDNGGGVGRTMAAKEVKAMAAVRRPGRPKKYSAAALEKAVEAYFNSISYRENIIRKVPEMDDKQRPVLDDMGHQVYKFEPVVTADGKPAFATRWIEPPGIMALCLYLGIDRATFDRYGKMEGETPEEERFRNTVTRARGRVEAYLVEQLENKSAARGAIFNLQQNFGWKDRKEISLDEGTQKAISARGMTMEEKLALLREIGDLPETEDG